MTDSKSQSERHRDAVRDPLTPDAFRSVMSNFATGVTVIGARDGEELVGMSANSFISVSLEPPLIGFCAAHTSLTYPRIKSAGAFCVNVLAEGQEEVARIFSRRGVDRFAEVEWAEAPSGSPILSGALAWVDCTLEQEFDVGDHLMVIGHVHAAQADLDASPLLFFRGRFAIERPDKEGR